MNKVLLILHESSHFTELLRLARLLKQDRAFEPVFLFARMLVFTPQVARVCSAEGIACVDTEGLPIDLTLAMEPEIAPGDQPTPIKTNGTEKKKVYPHLLKVLFLPLKKALAFLRRSLKDVYLIRTASAFLTARWMTIARFLDEHDFTLLVMAEDNVYFDTATWIKAGHKRGIPSIIVPYTISNPLEQAESAFYDPPLRIDSIQKKIIGRMYPRWVYVHKGIPLLRLPWQDALARERLRLAPPQPWMLNSGSADAIAVESKAMHNYYLKEGLPAEALVLTGALSDDELAGTLQKKDLLKRKLLEELHLDPTLPVALIALPPNQFPRACEFKSYAELTEFFVSLADTAGGWNMIIRPHPKQAGKELGLVSRPGCKVTWKDTASLVPLSSLYIASASATIRWAIACGIPVINYDVYRYHYADYINVPGVLVADDRETCYRLFERITSNSAYNDEIVSKQRQAMGDWGMLDGRSGQRMIALVHKLTGRVAGKGFQQSKYHM